MLEKLKLVEARYLEMAERASQPDFYADPQKAAKLLREKNDLEPIVEAFHAYNQAQQDMADAQELMGDPEETGKALREQYRHFWLVIVQRAAIFVTIVACVQGFFIALRGVPNLTVNG